MNKRTCKECGEILNGRSDQKFCDDGCRNAFNNKKLGTSTLFMRKINRILKKNHTILKELNPNEKTTIWKSTLEKRGFSFSFYTHLYKTKTGREYYFCYDQGYSRLDNNKILLVQKQEI